jgi:hypothetical protein
MSLFEDHLEGLYVCRRYSLPKDQTYSAGASGFPVDEAVLFHKAQDGWPGDCLSLSYSDELPEWGQLASSLLPFFEDITLS